IGEIQPVTLSNFISHTTDNAVTFFLALFCFALLFIRHIKYLLPVTPFVIIGFSAFYSGYRYLIYASPFIGMGLGYFVYLFKDFISKRFNLNKRLVEISALAILVFLTFPAQRLFYETTPYLHEKQVDSFKTINEIAPKDAVIIAWWDIGNPFQYYAKRATFMDNENFNPLKAYVILKVFTESDEETAYRYVSFLTNHKSKDYHNIGSNLPALLRIASNYSEKPQSPVYILLYNQMLSTHILKDNALPKDEADMLSRSIPQHYFHCTITKDAKGDCEDIVLDLKDNTLQIVDNNVNIGYKKVVFHNRGKNKRHEFPLNPKAKHTIHLILSKEGKLYQINAHEDFEMTLLYRMLLVSQDNLRRFELVYENFPYAVLYRVK
ncbi:MAG: hypothetical protein SNJ53_08700, partial [Thermodesulfovibrionales bacterium]